MVFTTDTGPYFYAADLFCDQISSGKQVTRKIPIPASNSNLIQCKKSNE
jgi:hypothetical protein